MSVRKRVLAWTLMLSSSFAFGVAASAQDAQPAPAAPPAAKPAKEEAGVEVITVTARRKEENIQDIPIAVSAFSADDLGRSNIDDVSDVQFNVPNLSYSKTNFSGAGNITIRGVGNLATAATAENGTGVQINEAPFPGSRIFEAEFYDVQSVQVLRGPQGTLFGRSSPGGAINIYTKQPVLGEWGGYISGDYGEYNEGKIKYGINVPLGEHFAARLAGMYLSRDGYTKVNQGRFGTNQGAGKKIDDRNMWAIRGSLKGEWDDASFVLMAQYFRANDHRMRIQNQGCTPDPTDWPNGIGCLGGDNKLRQGGINYNSTLAYSSGFLSDTFAAVGLAPRFLSGPNGIFTPYALAFFGGGGIGPAAMFNYFQTNPCQLTPGTNTGRCPGYLLDNATGTAAFGPKATGYGLPLLYYNGSNRPSGLRNINTQLIPKYWTDEIQITFTPTVDITENLKLTSVTGWHQAFVNSYTDYWWSTPDQGFLNQTTNQQETRHFDFPDSPYGGDYGSEFVFDRSRSTDKVFTQELRLVSSYDGMFNFQVGANYNNGEVRGVYDVWGTSLESFWSWPGDALGLCPAAHASPAWGVSVNSCEQANPQGGYYRNEDSPTTLQSWAVFGELYFDLTSKTRLTVGGRYNDDLKTERQRVNLWTCFTNSPDLQPGSICGRSPYANRRAGFTQAIWKVSLDQHFDLPWAPESLAYITISTGYKGGGFNPAVDPNQSGGTAGLVPPVFKPENITAYEVGYKGTWFDQMQFALTGFYYDYKNMQIGKIVNRTAVNENIASKLWGVELETNWQPFAGLRFDLNVSWLDTQIQKGKSIDGADPTAGVAGWMPIKQLLPFPAGQNGICNPAVNPYCLDPFGGRGFGFDTLFPGGAAGTCATWPIVATPTQVALADLIAANPNLCGYVPDGFAKNLKGNKLPGASAWTVKGGLQYSLPAFKGWVATPRVEFYWRSQQFTRIYNTKKDKIAPWEQLDANIMVTKEGSPWLFEIWGKNLQNNADITGDYFTDPTSANFTNLFILEPRTIGATVRYTFGGSEN